jgi:hypothetical protein
MNDRSIEQALRRSHCAHKDRDDPKHPCVGSCLITPLGVTLQCKLCGDDTQLIAPSDTMPETRLVRTVLDALGISYDVLSPEYQKRAADVARRWIESYKSKG